MNCDGYLSAADIVALIPRLGTSGLGDCERADVNEDGRVDTNDLDRLIQLLFAE